MLHRVHLVWAEFKLTMLVVIGNDCTGSCKSMIKVLLSLRIWSVTNMIGAFATDITRMYFWRTSYLSLYKSKIIRRFPYFIYSHFYRWFRFASHFIGTLLIFVLLFLLWYLVLLLTVEIKMAVNKIWKTSNDFGFIQHQLKQNEIDWFEENGRKKIKDKTK
jgi:hypothetical protein